MIHGLNKQYHSGPTVNLTLCTCGHPDTGDTFAALEEHLPNKQISSFVFVLRFYDIDCVFVTLCNTRAQKTITFFSDRPGHFDFFESLRCAETNLVWRFSVLFRLIVQAQPSLKTKTKRTHVVDSPFMSQLGDFCDCIHASVKRRLVYVVTRVHKFARTNQNQLRSCHCLTSTHSLSGFV